MTAAHPVSGRPDPVPKRRDAARGSLGARFIRGYLPFAGLALAVAFALVSLSGSWAAVLVGGAIFLVWASWIVTTQLAVLMVPSGARYYQRCAVVTVCCQVVAPLLLLSWWQVIHDLSA